MALIQWQTRTHTGWMVAAGMVLMVSAVIAGILTI